MGRNDEIQATWQYHDGTKHSFQSLRSSRHVLDWPNQPIPYKIYTSLEPIPLPRDFPASTVPALDAITRPVPAPSGEQLPEIATLARLCFFSNGITKHLRYAGGEQAFRAAACTGALYHIELYLVCGDLPDLAAGVYHYAADDHALRRLRAGDFRQVLVDATGAEPAVAAAPVVVACTSTYWRNSWKYRARAYRHTYWDSGVILANLLAEASAVDLAARLVLGFADATVNHLLDVDPDREAAVSLVALGSTDRPIPPAPAVEPLAFPTAPLSPREVDYPAIRTMHAASSLDTGAQAAAWRGAPPPESPPPPAGPLVPLAPLAAAELPTDSLETVVRRRGSSRRFTLEPIGFGQLSTMLQCATAPIHADCMPPDQPPPTDLYLIVNAVEGLAPGTYALRRDRPALEQLAAGDFRAEAGVLDLDQELAAYAAVNVYFLGDLRPLLARYGNRGYRLAQLAGAIGGGRLYLAAYALRIGATGLTFFDDAVTQFFSPHAAGKSVMFLVALGHPLRRAR